MQNVILELSHTTKVRKKKQPTFLTVNNTVCQLTESLDNKAIDSAGTMPKLAGFVFSNGTNRHHVHVATSATVAHISSEVNDCVINMRHYNCFRVTKNIYMQTTGNHTTIA